MAASPLLGAVLLAISGAKAPDELRAVAGAAAVLEDAEKDIARWAYAYAVAQIKGG